MPPHLPVLLAPLLAAVAPVEGLWVDATFGAGGYSRALLHAGAERVVAIDRDPSVFELAKAWAGPFGPSLHLVEDTFSNLDRHAARARGVVMDLGVSSMQLDEAGRGFSFRQDGPLDMRMGASGRSAADLINEASAEELADILHHYGEERAARRIARTIVAARAQAPITSTRRLAELVESCLPRARPGQSHPATRSFQALRIAVNDELGQLVAGLEAAERALAPGGHLAVVSFHSIEDRIVKRFLAQRSATRGAVSRHAPPAALPAPGFHPPARAITPDAAELAANPRARSARLRIATRTAAPARPAERAALGLPRLPHPWPERSA